MSYITYEYSIINFETSWILQKSLLFRKKLKIIKDKKYRTLPNLAIILKHPYIYTSSFKKIDISSNFHMVMKIINFHTIDRGGKISYHDSGQIICYCITDLLIYQNNLKKYLNILHSLIKKLLSLYKIKTSQFESSHLPGIWLQNSKIASIGIKIINWISMHGFSINLNINLKNIKDINLCGIPRINSINFIKLMHKISDNQIKYRLILTIKTNKCLLMFNK
uniref:lipoyl(octanoyl) transferase n=1 Tax=Cyanidium sp. THAL103 TaxID=3027999 RepID=A0A9Y1I429_9RHOD|nr:lipoate biosynthesis protein B [Cyanidium sp. THAL103]